MELFLGAEEALLIVMEAEEYPEEGDDAEVSSWNKRIAKAAAMINAACHTSIKPYIRQITDARKMWKTLAEKLDTTASRAGRCSLLRQFHALHPTSVDKSPFGVTEYINQLTEYSNRLEGSEQAISDETFIAHLTTTLPDTFKNIVDIILHQPEEDQTLTKVISTLVEWEHSEESRRTAYDLHKPAVSSISIPSDPSIASALNARTRYRSSSGQRHRLFNSHVRSGITRSRGSVGSFQIRNQRYGSNRGWGSSRSRSQSGCWYCGKRGHIQKDCYKRRDQQNKISDKGGFGGNGNHTRSDRGSITRSADGTPHADLAVVHALTATSSRRLHTSTSFTQDGRSLHVYSQQDSFDTQLPNQCWIIDSGASHHLTSDSRIFATLHPLQEDIAITVGNGATIKAIGTGPVSLEFQSGNQIAIEVLYVPGIQRSLLSVSQLNNILSLTFKNGYCYSGSEIIGVLRDGLYEMMATPVRMRQFCPYISLPEVSCAASGLSTALSTSLPSLEMWHFRLGHLGLDALKKLLPPASYADNGNADTVIKGCLTCIQAKQQRSYNRKPVQKTTKPFHLLHSDLCGPLALSHSGYRYFILYIDDFSRSTWVYFLRSKKAEEVVSVFQEFQAMVDTQYPEYTIRRFRCDNGRGEYDNTFFRGILRVRGISFEPSPPYTQHKNGVSERMIRTISTKARSMLLDSRMEDIFWAEAVNTATYLHSRSPSFSLHGRTPYEVLNGRKPELQHLRRFGSAAHKLIPAEQRNGKFSPRSRLCLMLGYVHHTTKIWRLWDPVEARAIQASNVKFDEALIQGKRVLDEPVRDTLHALANPETEGDDLSDDNGVDTRMEAISSGLFTDVRKESLQAHNDSPLQTQSPQIPEAKIRIAVDPNSYTEAMGCDQHHGWKNAMKEEFASLKANETWAYVSAGNKHAIGCRWVFKTKVNADNSIRLKARLVIKGYEQVEGTDYGETYAPVAKLVSFRLLLALAARNNWLIDHMDVVTAFLNPPIDEDIYMEAPEGVEWLEPSYSSKNGLICKLKKSLYGLKQAPRLWFEQIDSFLQILGFRSTASDPNIYISSAYHMIILLYVDDLLIISPSSANIAKVKSSLSQKYKMSDLGPVKQFLGIELKQIQHSGTSYWAISQCRFISTILSRFGMSACRGVTTPLDKGKLLVKAAPDFTATLTSQKEYQTLIGSLMYLMIATRPDLAYTVSTLSKFSSNPSSDHFCAAKRVLRYLQSTATLSLTFIRDRETQLEGYSDSDWAGDRDDSKSTSGYLFTLSGATICWKSRKQKLIALSSTEAEYIALTETAKEASWLRSLYLEISSQLRTNISYQGSIPIHADNQASIHLAKISHFHERTKHIGIRYHYVRTAIENGLINISYVPTTQNPADILTKALPRNLHEHHLTRLGLHCFA